MAAALEESTLTKLGTDTYKKSYKGKCTLLHPTTGWQQITLQCLLPSALRNSSLMVGGTVCFLSEDQILNPVSTTGPEFCSSYLRS